MFPSIEYLEWIHGRPSAAEFDLGSSDLGHTDTRSDPIPGPLAGLPDPPAETTLETQLADRYDVDPEAVVVTAGATHANFLVAAAAIDDADGPSPSVLVEKPGYEPLIATPRALGATITRFRRPLKEGAALSPERVGGAVDDATALVTVTNRHNPTAAETDRATIDTVADRARSAGARVLVDEVYAPYTTTPAAGRGFGGPTAAGLADVVVTGSLTKAFGLGGLQIGWIVTAPSFIETVKRVANHVPAVADPSRQLGRRALYHADTLLEDARDRIEHNGRLLADFVADRSALSGPISADCTYGFPTHERADGDEIARAAWEAGILVVPGRFFGFPERFRLSVTDPSAQAERALAAFGDVLADL
ncbi:MAG: pyridoxal phosphate-dependent aminotransferase [Halobacteriales archaeon]